MDNIYWMGNGKYQKDYDELWERLVPARGNAATKAGEVLRAVSRIYYRWYNDGDRIQPRLNESVAVSAIKAFKYLYQFLDLGSGFSTRKLMEDIVFADTEEDYELALERAVDAIIEWAIKQPDTPNSDDFLDEKFDGAFEFDIIRDQDED